MSATLLPTVPDVALTLVLKASLILLVTAAAQLLLRHRASAAMRHGIWTLAIAALLVLPLCSVALPSWAVMPAWQAESIVPPIRQQTQATNDRVAIETPDSTASASTFPLAQTTRRDWQGLAHVVYVTGLFLLLLRLLADQLAVRRLASAAHEVRDIEWTSLLEECRTLVGRRTPVRLLRTSSRITPMAFGIRKPAIVISELADTWTRERRRAVLLHELAHIERRDCLTQTLASLAAALYWVHPGVWWAARRLQVEREYACDDRVLGLGASPSDYAGHLLDIAYSLGAGRTPALAVGMARRGQLEGRLLAALDSARNRAMPGAPGRLIAVLATVAVLVPLAAMTASTRAAATALPTLAFDEPDAAPLSEPAPAVSGRPDAVALQTASEGTSASGAWQVEPSDKPGRVYLELRQRHSSNGRDVALTSLEGLSQSAMASGGAVTFTLRRDAGTFTFEGTFRNRMGAGTYSFAPSATFADTLEKRGIGRPTAAQQHELAKADVGLGLVDALSAQGYEKPTIDDLVRAGQHGVDTEFVRGMGQLGYRVGTVAALIKMRDHGVTPDYVQGLMAEGLPKLSADDLVRARDHGVTPDYVRAMRQAGYASLGVDALVNARDHGVTPDYVKAMGELGYAKIPLDALINARDHGVTGDYVKGMGDLGYTSLPLDALVNARDHGVTADFARSMRDLGQRLELKELVRARDHGVTPDYVKELKTLGYDQLSIDDLVTLRDHGVTPDKVRRANARAGSKLPPDMLRSLADGGSL